MATKQTIERLPHDKQLELLIGAVIDYALYLISTEGRIVSWNAGARRLKGYEEEEIIGREFAEFLYP